MTCLVRNFAWRFWHAFNPYKNIMTRTGFVPIMKIYIATAFSMYSSLESGLQNSWRTFWNDYYQYINVSQLLVFWGLFYSSLVLCKAPTKNRHQWRPIFFRRVVILSARPLFVRSFFHIRHIVLSPKAYYDLFWNFFLVFSLGIL